LIVDKLCGDSQLMTQFASPTAQLRTQFHRSVHGVDALQAAL
jgi:hypothetical protein